MEGTLFVPDENIREHGGPGIIEANVTRTTLTAAQLYAFMEAEFSRLKPRGCRRCRFPIPYWRTPPDDVSANWDIGRPPECPHGCHLVVAELVTRTWTRYDLLPERQN